MPDDAPVAVVLVDPTGTVVGLNPSALEILDASWTGRHIRELFADPAPVEQLLVAGDSGVSTVLVASVDGRWLELRARGRSGSPGRTMIVVRDATEWVRSEDDRGRVEKALRDNANLLRAITESTSDVIFVKDLEGRYLWMNGACQALLGRSAAELQGVAADEVFQAEEADAIREHDREVMRTVSQIQVEEHITVGGVRRTFLSSKSPYLDDEGRVAGVIAIATDITRRKAFEQSVARRARERASIAEFGREALTTESRDMLTQRAARLVATTLDVDIALVLEVSEAGSPVSVRASFGVDVAGSTEPADNGSHARFVLDARGAVVTDRLSSEPRFSPSPILLAAGARSGLAAAIPGSSGSRGLIAAYTTTRRRRFTEEDTAYLVSVANVLGAAFAREDADAERRLVRDRLAILLEAADLIGSSLDPSMALVAVAELAVLRLADCCVVDIVNDAGAIERLAIVRPEVAQRRLAPDLPDRYPLDPASPFGPPSVIRNSASELATDVDGLPDGSAQRRLLSELGIRSALVVPMIARGRALGAISLLSATSRRYTQADQELAEDLAGRASLAYDNARLYTERAHVAHTLQEGLLPQKLPEVPGAEIALRYRPATADIGGDFYDVFSAGPGAWSVVMGDVCGKGVEAAALIALARYTLHAAAIRSRRPSRVLRLLNEAMLQQVPQNRFSTVAYARLLARQDGFRMSLCCAGHPLPLVVRDGSVAPVGMFGSALGVFEDAKLVDTTIELRPGDMLLLYTDGVVEARGPEGTFGEERLTEIAEQLAALSPQQLVAAIEERVLDYAQGAPADDFALLAIRVTGP